MKNYYITVSMQKISPIHQSILAIQKICEAHGLKGCALIFNHTHLNIIGKTLSM